MSPGLVVGPASCQSLTSCQYKSRLRLMHFKYETSQVGQRATTLRSSIQRRRFGHSVVLPSFITRPNRGFASAPSDYTPCSDSLSLRLRSEIHNLLKNAHEFVVQRRRREGAPTACEHMVQELFPLLFSTFALSFTVLVHYQSGVWPCGWSGNSQEFSCSALLRIPPRKLRLASHTQLSYSGCAPKHSTPAFLPAWSPGHRTVAWMNDCPVQLAPLQRSFDISFLQY